MSWIRRVDLDVVFNEMHGIKPIVESMGIDRNCNKIKLTLNGKSVVLTEFLEKGLTKYVSITVGNIVEKADSVYKAELRAKELLA